MTTSSNRQNAYILALLNGPKTVRQIDLWVRNYLNLKTFVSEPTRNRDLKALRKKGYEIITEKSSHSTQPVYKLNNFELSFPLVQEDLCVLLELINLGFELNLLKSNPLLKRIHDYSDLINTKNRQMKFDIAHKLTHLTTEDLRIIRTGINKRCAIEFIYHRLSVNQRIEIKGYPKEIILMDKFLYLIIKIEKSGEWKEYRLDRLFPPPEKEHIILHKKNYDLYPNDSKPSIFLKCRILPPLSKFFDPSIWSIKPIRKEPDDSIIYAGLVNKSRFRILKDALAFLPYIQILEEEKLAKEFKSIVEESYKLLLNFK